MTEPSEAKTVLLVENDPDVREAMHDVLERRGFHTLTAEHGGAALALLRAGLVKPSLILLDLTMPVMNGWEFLDAQAADPAIADIPVVVMSALPSQQGAAAARPLAGTLPKPITLKSLVDTVQRFCT